MVETKQLSKPHGSVCVPQYVTDDFVHDINVQT